MYKYRNNNCYKGFSFVEISIVCAIMMVLLVPIFTLMSRGNSGTVRNRNEILAQQYASNIIAYCNAMSFDDDFLTATDEKIIPNDSNMHIDAGDNVIKFNITEENFSKIATRTISIKDFDGNGDWPCKYKLVTTKVEWLQPGETKTRNITITGVVSER